MLYNHLLARACDVSESLLLGENPVIKTAMFVTFRRKPIKQSLSGLYLSFPGGC